MHEALYSLCCEESEEVDILMIDDDLPGVAHTDTMINVTQNEFHELIGENSAGISETKKRVISKDSSQTHGAGMQDSLMAKTAQTPMTVNNFNALTNTYVSEDGEE